MFSTPLRLISFLWPSYSPSSNLSACFCLYLLSVFFFMQVFSNHMLNWPCLFLNCVKICTKYKVYVMVIMSGRISKSVSVFLCVPLTSCSQHEADYFTINAGHTRHYSPSTLFHTNLQFTFFLLIIMHFKAAFCKIVSLTSMLLVQTTGTTLTENTYVTNKMKRNRLR